MNLTYCIYLVIKLGYHLSCSCQSITNVLFSGEDNKYIRLFVKYGRQTAIQTKTSSSVGLSYQLEFQSDNN